MPLKRKSAARAAARAKPVLVVKTGRHAAGAKAALAAPVCADAWQPKARSGSGSDFFVIFLPCQLFFASRWNSGLVIYPSQHDGEQHERSDNASQGNYTG